MKERTFNNMVAWDILRNGRVIDTVFYTDDCDLHYVQIGRAHV